MLLNIIVFSKDYKSIILFLNFFFKFCVKSNIKFNKLFFKRFQKKKKKMKFTILKSPHVNKKAQKEFKYFLFLKKLEIFSFQILKLLIILKKIKIMLFFDIKIQVKFLLSKNKILIKKKLLNPDKFLLKIFSKIKKSKNQLYYLKLFDIFGEFFLK